MASITMVMNNWPNFKREGLKEKIVIATNSLLILCVILSLVHSYRTKSLRQTKAQMVLIHLMIIISILNPPEKEIGQDHHARATSKLIVQVITYLLQSFLLTDMMEKAWQKVIILQCSILIMWGLFIIQLTDKKEPTWSDIRTFIIGISTTVLTTSFFAYVHKNIEKVVFDRQLDINELE